MQALFTPYCYIKTYILPKRWLLLVCDTVCTGSCEPTYRAAKYKAPIKRRNFKPLLRIFICHDDGSSAISRNVGTVLYDYRASHFVRPQNFVATSLITTDLTKIYTYIRFWHLSTQKIYEISSTNCDCLTVEWESGWLAGEPRQNLDKLYWPHITGGWRRLQNEEL